jgi:hypothetical protein
MIILLQLFCFGVKMTLLSIILLVFLLLLLTEQTTSIPVRRNDDGMVVRNDIISMVKKIPTRGGNMSMYHRRHHNHDDTRHSSSWLQHNILYYGYQSPRLGSRNHNPQVDRYFAILSVRIKDSYNDNYNIVMERMKNDARAISTGRIIGDTKISSRKEFGVPRMSSVTTSMSSIMRTVLVMMVIHLTICIPSSVHATNNNFESVHNPHTNNIITTGSSTFVLVSSSSTLSNIDRQNKITTELDRSVPDQDSIDSSSKYDYWRHPTLPIGTSIYHNLPCLSPIMIANSKSDKDMLVDDPFITFAEQLQQATDPTMLVRPPSTSSSTTTSSSSFSPSIQTKTTLSDGSMIPTTNPSTSSSTRNSKNNNDDVDTNSIGPTGDNIEDALIKLQKKKSINPRTHG